MNRYTYAALCFYFRSVLFPKVSHSCPIPSEVTIDERVECNSSQTSTLALRNASSSLSLSQPIPPLVKHTKSVQEVRLSTRNDDNFFFFL